MAQYWYKKDKRILRISEDDISRDVIKRVKELKEFQKMILTRM